MKDLNEKLSAFKDLLNIMDELREKCPWDRKQTIESLRNLTIEETYELADAIIENDLDEIRKELGDLILHIVFYSKIGEEKNAFDIADVINGINEKLIFRHPHVFGDTQADTADQVKENWEEIKRKEGHRSVLAGVPDSLPAMIKANRVQEKVRAVGFDWEEPSGVWEKVEEEIIELKTAIADKDEGETEKEFGDLLFSAINAARLHGVDPETALEKTNRKFIKRFLYLEKQTLHKGRELKEMTLDEMDEIWEKAKDFD